MMKVFKKIRGHFGWSQQEMAERAGVSVATIWAIENGKKPSKKVLTKILKAFCLNIDDLLTDPELSPEGAVFLENKKCERLFYGKTL